MGKVECLSLISGRGGHKQVPTYTIWDTKIRILSQDDDLVILGFRTSAATTHKLFTIHALLQEFSEIPTENVRWRFLYFVVTKDHSEGIGANLSLTGR